MTDRIAKFFGVASESDRVRRLVKIAVSFTPIAGVAFMMSTTFYFVFIAETLFPPPTPLKYGMAVVGILSTIGLAVQSIIDYPSGGLGDWIGQRWILFTSMILFAAAMVLMYFAQASFIFFLIVFLLQAVATAQQSGAVASWFDNNYRAVAKDPKRSAYSVAQGRMGMLFQIAATVSLIPGAVLAGLFGRQMVFLFQAVLLTIMGFGALALFRDYPEVAANRPHRSLRAYYGLLKDGLKFTVSSKLVFLFLIGETLMSSVITVWGSLLLFLIYYTYLYSDVAVAIFRTILFAAGVVSIERAGVWTRNLVPPRWMAKFRIFETCGPAFMFAFAVITFLLPPLETVPPFPFMYLQLPAILISLGFIICGFFGAAGDLLSQRFMLDLIPDRIRNGIYSLMPSLTIGLAVPQLLVFAILLPVLSVSTILACLSLISAVGCLLLAAGLRLAPQAAPSPEEVAAPPPGKAILDVEREE
jgi:MFS family permease